MLQVQILLFEGVEVLDACGPFEVFATTRDAGGRDLFAVQTVAALMEPVRAVGGLTLLPHQDFASAPPADIVLVPGGVGRKAAMADPATLEWVRRADAASQWTLSVCTGSFVLAHAGVLPEGPVSTHHSAFDEFAAAFPRHRVTADRYSRSGKVITSAGIAAGIDMSLHVVELIHGAETARRTAARMEYAPAAWTG